MKERLNYKSKRALIIGITSLALFATATVGTVLFIKGNNDARAASENETSSNTSIDTNTVNNETDEGRENANNNTDTNTNDQTDNGNADANTDGNNDNQNGGDNNAPDNAPNNQDNQNNNNNQNNQNNNNQNNQNNNNQNNQNNNNNGGANNQAGQNEPEYIEYTQTGETVERKISDEFLVSWTPVAVKAITEKLNKPELEIRKDSYINNETEEDTDIHTAVVEKDYITYKIRVKNNGNVDAKNVYIYDRIPEGTKLTEAYDNGIEKNGKITWIKDVKAGEEISVSFRVRVDLTIDEEKEEIEITQIDNTAIVDGTNTNTTHNPIITAMKEVKAIAENENGELKELDNQAVVPGSRLRYYITLNNDSEYDGTTIVTDAIPEGTTLIKGTISEGGEADEKNVITWKNVEVKAGETVKLYFDVIVNKGTRNTVTNKAQIGPDRPEVPVNPDEPVNPEDPTNPDEPTNPEDPTDPHYTNEVQTPVIIARKKSVVFDGKSAAEKTKVRYLVEIVATEVDSENAESIKVATAKLVDKFWTNDEDKVTFISGTLKVEDKDGKEYEDLSNQKLSESEINNIEVELNPGDKASIEYVYELNTLPRNVESQTVKNNLYWATPGEDDPSRPEVEEDTTKYENPNPDEDNEFKNEDLKDYVDPTDPEVDPEDEDTTTKDPTEPIDTVVIETKPIKAEKKVNPVSKNGDLLNNQAVVPGSKIRYTITLTNEADIEGETSVTDVIPEGTTLVEDSITDDGKVELIQNSDAYIIIWNDLKVPGRTKSEDGKWINGTKEISFDVIINKSTRETVENQAFVGTNPEEPETQKPTNKVQTPVIIARKTSKVYDGKNVGEKTKITYLVEIVSTAVDRELADTVKPQKVRLVDQFWIGDEDKVSYVENSLKTTGNVTIKESEQETIKNIEVTLGNDDKATLEYSFEANNIPDGAKSQVIKNNLYWTLPSEDEPERPETDKTHYENPNPDKDNEFKNDDLVNYTDPTAPEVDGNDNDETIKDTKNPIDTVVVTVKPISGQKRVNPLAYNDKTGKYTELDNQPVVPGSRLRYTITLTNDTDYAGTTNVSDVIPTGTELIDGTISDGGTVSGNTIKWSNISVPGKTKGEDGKWVNGTKDVTFEVVVKENNRETVKNLAKVGTNPDPDKQRPTNEVETPVLLARKTSKVYDGNSYTEKTKITYLVEIVATTVKSQNSETVSATTAKLVDKFWTNDNSKVTFVSGNLKVNNVVKKANLTESEIENISVSLKAGDKASIEYIYEAKDLPANVESQLIKNNLYWAKPGQNDPARPGDETEYSNPNPDSNNEFKNDELKNYVDPTAPEVDPKDNDTSNKDPKKPIDTVVVEIFSIKAKKKVNAVSANGTLLDNQPVVPGSRLRYSIELTNNSKNEGTINVSDVVPTGTTLISGTITNGGTNSNGTIKWNNLKVPANKTITISFDVTVNNNTRATVKNAAKTGTDPDPSKQTPTNEVQTPVVIARKTSKVSDGKTLSGNNVNEVTYLVEIVATDVTSSNTAEVKEATIKLIDKFWTGDDSKVEYKEGSLRTTGFVNGKSSDEETIKNIEAKLSAGGKATLQYTFKLKQLGNTVNKDIIENNLYWKKPGTNDPARPNNAGDTTNYSNPNPDTNNQFKNDELKNYTDPTNPEKDPSDNDNTDKDAAHPIDTVKVTLIKYGDIDVIKNWVDNGHTDQRPSNGITVKLYGRNKQNPVRTVENFKATGNDWTIKFENLPLADDQGTIPYSVSENAIANYATSITGLKITNTYRQDVEGLITINNSKTSTIPVDVVFVLDISSSMLTGTKATDLANWENGITPPNRFAANNRAIDMVASVNATIKNIMEANPNNRVGIALFNRQGYEMLQLGRYTAKSNGQYIKFANKANGDLDESYESAYILANVNQNATTQSVHFYDNVNGSWNVNKKIGTNTQAGIITGRNIFNKVSSTVTNYNGAGKGVKHNPIMILLTDGDPTHLYTTKTIDPRDKNIPNYNNVPFVANGNINPNSNPKFPEWEDTIKNETDECYGLVDKVESIYYSKTMDTIHYAKNQVTNIYSKAGDGDAKTCKLYTIGMYMKGAMAEALLNPSAANIRNLNNNLDDISSEITNSYGETGITQITRYKDRNGNVLTGKAYYNKQQRDLYNLLGTNYSNYANGSFNGKMTQAQMNNAFNYIVSENTQETITISINDSRDRAKVELPNLANAATFSLKVRVPKTAAATTYTTVNAAVNSGYIVYDPNTRKYYADLSKIPVGSTGRIDIEYKLN